MFQNIWDTIQCSSKCISK